MLLGPRSQSARCCWGRCEPIISRQLEVCWGPFGCGSQHRDSQGPSGGPSSPPSGPRSTAGGPEDQPLTPMDPGPQSGLGRSLKILVAVSVPLLLLLLFLLQGHQCRGQCRKAGLSTAVTSPEATQGHQSPADEDPWAVTYVEVSHSRIGHGGLSTSSPESGIFLVMKDTSEGEDSLQTCQVAASEPPQDVTYAQLKDLKLRQETATPPSSQGQERPAESSVYATLAIH
ncbi:leukocyte immunoglobulin-like receptor subfamily B member 5 isoform X5 [Marmota monax]|uniref:leukocyte immunoglobulin-like receptor subfamily B member 5 isoform X5 n=1 Tax=Marmota monax TaxID=9995 RepID=UPI0026F28811|nr:leukocyte immunoglobulin-like receptor subfamily B member 5 isoform X5 [Marmota monax]